MLNHSGFSSVRYVFCDPRSHFFVDRLSIAHAIGENRVEFQGIRFTHLKEVNCIFGRSSRSDEGAKETQIDRAEERNVQ